MKYVIKELPTKELYIGSKRERRLNIFNIERANFKSIKGLILSIILVFQFFSLTTLMVYPKYWGDEGTIANCFENYNRNGIWEVSFHKFAPLQGQYHMGRFYLFLLSIMDRFLHYSPLSGRLLSFISALGILICFYLISRKVIKDVILSLFLTLSLASAGLFVFASHFTRFEMFALFWFLLSILFLITAYETNRKSYLLLCGLCLSIMIEIHIIAIIMIVSLLLTYLFIFKNKPLRKISNLLIYFFLPVLFFSLLWVLNRYWQNPHFLNEILFTRSLVISEGTYLSRLLHSLRHSMGYGYTSFANLPDVIFIIAMVAATFFLVRSDEKKSLIIISANLSFLALFLIFARFNAHYLVYFLPLQFMVVGIILKKLKNLRLRKAFLILLISFVFLNLLKHGLFFTYSLATDYDFPHYGNRVKEEIPGEPTVLVYQDLAHFFGDRFISNRDLEFAIDLEGMDMEEYINKYKIKYIVHDHYFEYLLDSRKIDRNIFNNYLRNNLKLIAEVEDPEIGVYQGENRRSKRITKIYQIVE